MRIQQVVAGIGMFLGTAACAVAQEAAAVAASPAVKGYGMSFRQAWEYGGWVMWLLAAISVFALAMVFYFMIVLRSGAVTPHELMVDLLARIRAKLAQAQMDLRVDLAEQLGDALKQASLALIEPFGRDPLRTIDQLDAGSASVLKEREASLPERLDAGRIFEALRHLLHELLRCVLIHGSIPSRFVSIR